MNELAYIYLLQDGKDKGTNIYKIGRTTQKGGDSRKLDRLQSYSKGTVPYNIWLVNVNKINNIEDKIKEEFKKKYILKRGLEWFQGDVKQMKKDIDTIIENMEEILDDEKNQSISCEENFNNDDTYIHKTLAIIIDKIYKGRFLRLNVSKKVDPDGRVILFKRIDNVWERFYSNNDDDAIPLKIAHWLSTRLLPILYVYISKEITYRDYRSILCNRDGKVKIIRYFLNIINCYDNLKDMLYENRINNMNCTVWLGPGFGHLLNKEIKGRILEYMTHKSWMENVYGIKM